MVVVSYLFENALSCNTHIQAFISVFLWPPRFVSLFSLYVSFGFCTSCFRLSSVSDLGSQLTLNSGTRKSWDYKLRVGEGALQLLCYDLAGLFNLQFSLFRAFFFFNLARSMLPPAGLKEKKKKKVAARACFFFPVSQLHTLASVIHFYVCQDYSKLSFLILFLFSDPNLPHFLFLKPAQKARPPGVFPFISYSANHHYMLLLQNNLLLSCNLIICVHVLYMCICSMHRKPRLVWCCVPHGC